LVKSRSNHHFLGEIPQNPRFFLVNSYDISFFLVKSYKKPRFFLGKKNVATTTATTTAAEVSDLGQSRAEDLNFPGAVPLQ